MMEVVSGLMQKLPFNFMPEVLILKSIFRKKSIEELRITAERSKFTKSLTAFDLVVLGIGAIIGTGIFVLTGIAAAKYAGPSAMISFIVSGITCALTGLIYAELISIVPSSGSVYSYTYASLGEFVAFLVGSCLIISYTTTCSAVAVGWSGYINGLLQSAGYVLPKVFVSPTFDGGIINFPAIIIVIFLTILLIRGTRESVWVNKVLVFIKIAALLIFIVLSIPAINTENWDPFMPFGYVGIFQGASFVFFAYTGFDAVATFAEECRNPSRDLPIGILGSVFICMIFYTVIVAVLTGVIPYNLLDTPEPIAFALRDLGYNIGSVLVAIGAICGMTTVLLVLLYGQARIYFAMSRDGFFPQFICKLHEKFKTPYIINIMSCIFVSMIAGMFPIEIIVEMTNIGLLTSFIFATIAALTLRLQQPDLTRKFKCPAIWLVGMLAICSCSYLIYNLSGETLSHFAIWLFISSMIYFCYGKNNSLLGRSNSKKISQED